MSGPAGVPIVLTVDDNAANRYVVSRVLRREGYHVLEAANGTDALRLARQRPDLVVLDVRLPDIDGFEVCRRLRAAPETADLPVLHISASLTTEEHRAEGIANGADAYLTHPLDPAELLAVVAMLLRSRRPAPEVAPPALAGSPAARLATQLRAAADAAVAIASATTAENVIAVLTTRVRAILEARWCQASLAPGIAGRGPCTAVARALDAAGEPPADLRAFESRVRDPFEAVRLGPEAIAEAVGSVGPALRSWIGAAMTSGGRRLGLLQAADGPASEFSAEEAALLVQLAQLASVAIERASLYDGARDRGESPPAPRQA